MKNYICYIGLLFVLLFPGPSSAGTTLFVSPDGDGAFIIEGDNIGTADYIEITVNYDPTILADPKVSLQGGSVINKHDGIPGVLTFSAFRGDNKNSSFEAHVNFVKTSNSQGGFISVTGRTSEPDGTDSPSRSLLNLSSSPSVADQASKSSQEQVNTSASEQGCASRHGGDNSCKEKTGQSQPMEAGTDTVSYGEATVSMPEKSATTVETTPEGNRPAMLVKAEKSVLQRFKEFKGERGLKTFVALFEQSPSNRLVQEPDIVLSDGKTPVRIRLVQEPDAPNIALIDAKLIQLLKDGEKGWVITAMPKEGTWDAGLIITMKEDSTEFPLTVAPAVKLNRDITEINFVAELDRFIADQLAAGKGENDPQRRISYAYVFTANYLAGLVSDSRK